MESSNSMGKLILILCMVAAVARPIFFLAKMLCSWALRKKKDDGEKPELPPGSMGWPVIGETLEFISSARSAGQSLHFLDSRRRLYGKVFKSHLFGSPTIVSTDGDVNKFVLQANMTTFVASYPKSLMELMGKSSILVVNSSLQRKMHGLIGAFLKSPMLRSQVTADMQRHVERAMGAWMDGQLVYLQDEAKSIFFKVLVRGLMSIEGEKELQFLKRQFPEFIAGLMSLPIKLPGTRLYRSLLAKKKMVKLLREVIKERRKKRSNEDDATPRDVIDVFINDGSGHFTDELIAENVIDLMIPGEDSVPVLVSLAVKYLSDCPGALEQMEEENMRLKQMKAQAGQSLDCSDYLSLTFTQNVISETLRMGNVTTGIIRKAMRDINVKGHFIPKGWCVYMSLRAVHLDEDYYDEPYKFNPWRWQNKEMGTCNFTPFGGGQRLCPGLDLARLEASIFLHHLVTTFRWVAEDDTVVNFPTVRFKRRMPIRVNRKVAA